MTTPNATTRVVSGLGEQESAHTALPVLPLEKPVYSRALDCVHCGLCLPACPTYTDNGLEADSPRGRIVLIKGLADGKIDATPQVREHLDLCLDCRACETACPSGVVYHELIEETRHHLASSSPQAHDPLLQWLMFKVMPYPRRLKLAVLPARLLQKIGLGSLVANPPAPRSIKKLAQMLPHHGPLWEHPLKSHYPSTSPDGKRATVAFFAGCIGSALFQQVNRQSIALLQLAGCDVIVPPNQTCCGAIHHHAGRPPEESRRFAVANLDAFLTHKPDFIVANIAGCGAMLKEYDFLFRNDPNTKPRAADFSSKVRDITQVLFDLKLPKPAHPQNLTATYHDACHLLHAQKVSDPPRKLLESIPGLKLLPLPESDMCCGAAGTYNLTQPDMAHRLGQRKLAHIQSTNATACVTGNIGCAMQIAGEAKRQNLQLEVIHPVTLLHRAHFG